MADLTKGLFKPARDKAETTTSVSRSIAEAETTAREKKTARLKKLRLEKEASDAAALAAQTELASKDKVRKL
jgi:hypothetical protein